MADSKATALDANTTPALADVMYIVDNPGASPVSQKVTIESLLKLINVDGWIPAGETWTYASADDPTFTFTIAGVDLTTKYYPGMRLKLTQTTVKYFIITKVAFSTDTTITVYGGTDYDLANATITLPYYSTAKAPAGFPLDPAKWTVETLDTANAAQATPTATTWYNLGSISISIPIGAWDVYYFAMARCVHTGQAYSDVKTTLSTANNSESDADLTTWRYFESANGYIFVTEASKRKSLNLTSKTAYYLNAMTPNGATSIAFRGDNGKTVIRAVCAYL